MFEFEVFGKMAKYIGTECPKCNGKLGYITSGSQFVPNNILFNRGIIVELLQYDVLKCGKCFSNYFVINEKIEIEELNAKTE